jgi:hypothetical protein
VLAELEHDQAAHGLVAEIEEMLRDQEPGADLS